MIHASDKTSFILEYSTEGKSVTIILPTATEMVKEEAKIRKIGIVPKRSKVRKFTAEKTTLTPL